jgi:hypothetical protein
MSVDKDDVYFVIGTALAILGLLSMDWKLVWGRLTMPVKPRRWREVFLLVVVISSLGFSITGWYHGEHPSVDTWYFPQQQTVYAKSFLNETVELDGKVFDHCNFENVKLIYHGLGPVSLIQGNFKGQVWLGSDNLAIRNFGTADAELKKVGDLIQLHSWVTMDKNGNLTSIQ